MTKQKKLTPAQQRAFEQKMHQQALIAVTSFRHLKAYGLLTEDEYKAVGERLTEKYGPYLSPLREGAKEVEAPQGDEAADLLRECANQLEYLDARFPTGTTPSVLSRVQTFLQTKTSE